MRVYLAPNYGASSDTYLRLPKSLPTESNDIGFMRVLVGCPQIVLPWTRCNEQ